jgi:hypothetical protein
MLPLLLQVTCTQAPVLGSGVQDVLALVGCFTFKAGTVLAAVTKAEKVSTCSSGRLGQFDEPTFESWCGPRWWRRWPCTVDAPRCIKHTTSIHMNSVVCALLCLQQYMQLLQGPLHFPPVVSMHAVRM